jgi:hypothetical protein
LTLRAVPEAINDPENSEPGLKCTLEKIDQRELSVFSKKLCREGLFLLPYNELAVAQGPKIYQKNEL